jgi:ABC-type lipoprotein release transport system permease subunit
MSLVIKIAWRNILRHRGKSLLIGLILMLATLIMTVGNGVVSGMDQGLRRNIVRGFTGDISIISDRQETDDVFVSFINFSSKSLAPITNYPQIREVLGRQDYIAGFLPAGMNMAMFLNEEGGVPGSAFLLGVDFAGYKSLFPDNLQLVEGREFRPGERGILVPALARQELFEYSNLWLYPADGPLDSSRLPPEARRNPRALGTRTNGVLMGYGADNTAYDVRLEVKGIINYRALAPLWSRFVITDIESYRQCMGYLLSSEKPVAVAAADQAMLDMSNDNMDARFGAAESAVSAPAPAATAPAAAPVAAAPSVSVGGSYNLVFVRLEEGVSPAAALAKLNAALRGQNLGVRAVNWQSATSNIGSMSRLIQAALFLFVMFLFFVAIVVIVNTLSMAAVERTPEIGMMRAVGARQSFIGGMFVCETLILALAFGAAGMGLGAGAVYGLAAAHLTTVNDMVQLLFGGDTFQPLLTLGDLLQTAAQLAVVTAVAVLYPVRVARQITPLAAVGQL